MTGAKHRKKADGAKKRRIPVVGVCLLLVVAAAVAASSVTLSKYVLQSRQQTLAEAAGFCFDSDFFAPDGQEYDVYDWAGGFEISLKNFDAVNISQVDIDYTVAVIGGTVSPSSGTLIKNNQNVAELTISPTVGVGETIEVSVTTSPYNKSLSATFRLKDAGADSIYSYSDMGTYGILTIKTGTAPAGSVAVSYGTLAPDSTNSLMAGWTSGGSGTLSGLSPNSTYELVFFGSRSSTGEHIFTNGISIS